MVLVGVDGLDVENCLSRKSFGTLDTESDEDDLNRFNSLFECISDRYLGEVDDRMPILVKLVNGYGKFI